MSCPRSTIFFSRRDHFVGLINLENFCLSTSDHISTPTILVTNVTKTANSRLIINSKCKYFLYFYEKSDCGKPLTPLGYIWENAAGFVKHRISGAKYFTGAVPVELLGSVYGAHLDQPGLGKLVLNGLCGVPTLQHLLQNSTSFKRKKN